MDSKNEQRMGRAARPTERGECHVQHMGGAPADWAETLRNLGFSWTRSEAHPMADMNKLFEFTGDMSKLPTWAWFYP